MTIKARLTIAVVALLVVGTTVIGVVAVTTSRSSIVERIDARVVDIVEHPPARPGGGPGGPAGPPPGALPGEPGAAPPGPEADGGTLAGEGTDAFRDHATLVYDANGELVRERPSGFTDDPDPLPKVALSEALFEEPQTVDAVEGDVRYRAMAAPTPDGGTRVVASPLEDVDQATGDLIRVVLAALALIIVAGAALSYWLVRRGLKPVDDMIDAAGRIAAGAGDVRQIHHADDRTELGRLSKALNEMLEQIQGVQTRLKQFVADASHELRTPITSIRGYAELHRHGGINTDEQRDRAMARIESEGARMARLVDDLLLLAKLDEAQPLEQAPVDLARLATDAVGDLQAVDRERPVSVQVHGGAYVDGDERRLRQVLAILLTNARVHTPPGTPIQVSVTKPNGAVVLEVRDRGPGFPDDERERIFERFHRSDPSRSRDTGGSGLGLSIAAAIVKQHGGEIAATNDDGARFEVRLPGRDGER